VAQQKTSSAPQDEELEGEELPQEDLEGHEQCWLVTEGRDIVATTQYRGIEVILTKEKSLDLEEGEGEIGYRFIFRGEWVDDGVFVEADPTDDDASFSWDELRSSYESAINEYLTAAYPWQEGDKSFWQGRFVSVVPPFDRGYLYVEDESGERHTLIPSAVIPLTPVRETPV